MPTPEPSSSSSSNPEDLSGPPPAGGTSRGRGRFNPSTGTWENPSGPPGRSQRRSLEVFGGAPASSRYLPGAGAVFGPPSVDEDEPVDKVEPPLPRPWAAVEAPPMAPKIESPPVAPKQSSQESSITSMVDASKQPTSVAPPSLSPQRMRPMELMHIPAYKPKPVIGGESSAPPQVSRHTRSSSDSVAQVLANVETDRRVSLESFKQQVSLSKFLVDFLFLISPGFSCWFLHLNLVRLLNLPNLPLHSSMFWGIWRAVGEFLSRVQAASELV